MKIKYSVLSMCLILGASSLEARNIAIPPQITLEEQSKIYDKKFNEDINRNISNVNEAIKVQPGNFSDNRNQINSQNNNQQTNVLNNQIQMLTNGRDLSERSFFSGVEDLGEADDMTTINYISGEIKDEDIIHVKKKKDDLAKITNSPHNNIILKSDTIYYNPEKGVESSVYLKYGYSTDVEFLDELGNPIPVRGISIGNKIFDASLPEPHMISMLATSKYKETNFNVRLEGINDPIILRVKEGANNISHTRLKVVLNATRYQNPDDDMNLKTNILTELLKYGTLHGDTQLDYEVVDIARKETSYFEKKNLKIFKVQKYNKYHTIVLLDNMYEILGMNKNAFNRYQNTFNVYFLPPNKEVFTIMTKLNNSKDSLSLNHQKDHGLIEKYRIIISE